MKTIPPILLALASAGILSSVSANASGIGAYVKADAGAAFTQDVGVSLDKGILGLGTVNGKLKTKSGQSFNGTFGIHMVESVAVEFEVGYQQNDFSALSGYGSSIDVTGSASVVPLLLNVAWTPKLSDRLSAQIGVGAGAAIVNADLGISGIGSLPGETKAVVAGQAKAGLSYNLTENISADLTYRLRVMDGPGFSSGIKADTTTSHLVTAGLCLKF